MAVVAVDVTSVTGMLFGGGGREWEDVDAAVVGDLVMVIGEVRRAPPPLVQPERRDGNVTSDGGSEGTVPAALRHAAALLLEGFGAGAGVPSTRLGGGDASGGGGRVLFSDKGETSVGEVEGEGMGVRGVAVDSVVTSDMSRGVGREGGGRQTGGCYLRARIARCVNGTDMLLQCEALRLRRRHMLERMGDGPYGAAVGYAVGCGPPVPAQDSR